MRANGVDIYAISIQNRPWLCLRLDLVDSRGAGVFSARLCTPDWLSHYSPRSLFNIEKNFRIKFLNDPAALANLDILGTHLYGTDLEENFLIPFLKKREQEKNSGWQRYIIPIVRITLQTVGQRHWKLPIIFMDAMVEGRFSGLSGGISGDNMVRWKTMGP